MVIIMNREYKFRAWHPEDKVMVYDLNSPQLFHGILKDFDCTFTYIFMQYTGLKDKNRREIYEGDIVKTDYSVFINKTSDIHVVKFGSYPDNEGYACRDHWGFFIKNVARNYFDALSLGDYQDSRGIEVIGNIYENPELMEKIR